MIWSHGIFPPTRHYLTCSPEACRIPVTGGVAVLSVFCSQLLPSLPLYCFLKGIRPMSDKVAKVDVEVLYIVT